MSESLCINSVVRRVQREIKRHLDAAGKPLRQPVLAIWGDIGVGKTWAATHALAEYSAHGHHVIEITQPERRPLKIGNIISAMVSALGETPRRDSFARSEQLRRLLGERSADKHVVLVIDDADMVPDDTLRALKRVLELGFAARRRLFCVILIGNSELQRRLLHVPTLALRARKLGIPDLSFDECQTVVKWIAEHSDVSLSDPVVAEISRNCNTPAALVGELTSLLYQAESLGQDKVTVELARAHFGDNRRTGLAAQGYDQRSAARKIGVHESAVSRALTGRHDGDPGTRKVIQALDGLIAGTPVPAGAS